MRIDPAGYPFVAVGLVTSALCIGLGWWWVLPPMVATAFLAFFFRDPDRPAVATAGAIVSPADGRVMVAGAPTGESPPPGEWQQVSIFLSPMNVHVNRVPWGGHVTKVSYHPGRFLPAYRKEAGDLNEFAEVWVDRDHQTVVFRQIVGVLARRVVCRVSAGDQVETGQRFGVMKFGSRMDVFFPPTAKLLVQVGARVVGGVTILASLPGPERSTAERIETPASQPETVEAYR